MIKYFLLFNLFFISVHCSDPIYINKIVDSQLERIGQLLRQVHIKYITLGDVTVNDDIKATNLKFGDVTKITRKGDAQFWTDEDTISSKAAVGIDKMYLLMDKLYFNGKSYPKALIVVYSNQLSFSQRVYTTKTECNQTLSGIKVSNVRGVMMYSKPKTKMNITSQFIKEVVPFINKKLSDDRTIQYLQKILSSCKAPKVEDVMAIAANLQVETDDDSAVTSSESYDDNPDNSNSESGEYRLLNLFRRMYKLQPQVLMNTE